MSEQRVFVNSGSLDGNWSCPVCHRGFEIGDKFVLVPVQKCRTSVAIPVHEKCYEGAD